MMMNEEDAPATGSAGHVVLGAAGEAAAFLAGAPIAGAADAAAGLGDVVANREAKLDENLAPRRGTPRIWLVIGALVVIAALVWALKG